MDVECISVEINNIAAESLIKYISSVCDFIKNQVRHHKKRVPSHGGKTIA